MDQSASGMFQRLSENLLEGRHCFIVRGFVLMTVNQEYLPAAVVVEQSHFVAGAS